MSILMILKVHDESGEAGEVVGNLALVAVNRPLRGQQQARQALCHLKR